MVNPSSCRTAGHGDMATSEHRMYSTQADPSTFHSSIPPLFLCLLGVLNLCPLFLVSELMSVYKSTWQTVE